MGINRTRIAIWGDVTTLLLFTGIGLLTLLLSGCRVMNDQRSGEGKERSHRIYYVSVDGDDGNYGRSVETAFRTIDRALGVVQPGDTIQLLPGVYNEALMLEHVGNSDHPITIRSEDSQAVLDGQRVLTIGFWCENCTNFVFENLEIRNYTDVGIGVYQGSDIEMRDLLVHNNGFDVQLVGWEFEGYGIDADESRRVIIEDSDVYENGPQPRLKGILGTGINTYRCIDCVIRNNRSHDNIGGGILVEDGVNVLVEGNEVMANYLDATEDEWWDGGIWIDGGHNVTVVNNVFRDNIGPGIQISDEDDQNPYGYVLEGNVSIGNYYGIYIWNFRSSDFPSEKVLRMSSNRISGNSVQDIWIVP